MTTTEAVLKLTREIVDRWFATEPHGAMWSVKAARMTAEDCALAAILEVTERAAGLADRIEDAADDDWNAKYDMHDQGRSAGACEVATALRNMEFLK